MARFEKTGHTGISTNGRGDYKVRAAIKRNRKVLSRKATLSGTLGDALVLYQELKEALEGGRSRKQKPTVADWSESWLREKAARVRENTAEGYLYVLSEHILPHIGHMYLDDVSRRTVLGLIETWVRGSKDDGEPYSKASLKAWWRVAKPMIRAGRSNAGLPDPTIGVTLPRLRQRPKAREQRTLTAIQVRLMLDLAERHIPERYAEICTLVLGGFRPSEMYALEPGDIDYTTGEITISKSVDRKNRVDLPKTGRDNRIARRTTVVPKKVVLAIRAHRERLLASGRAEHAKSLIFPSRTGTPRASYSLDKTFAILQGVMGLDLALGCQVLRRTYNTLMQAAGVSNTILHAQIGHTDDAMTELYSHVSYEDKAAAVARFEEALAC